MAKQKLPYLYINPNTVKSILVAFFTAGATCSISLLSGYGAIALGLSMPVVAFTIFLSAAVEVIQFHLNIKSGVEYLSDHLKELLNFRSYPRKLITSNKFRAILLSVLISALFSAGYFLTMVNSATVFFSLVPTLIISGISGMALFLIVYNTLYSIADNYILNKNNIFNINISPRIFFNKLIKKEFEKATVIKTLGLTLVFSLNIILAVITSKMWWEEITLGLGIISSSNLMVHGITQSITQSLTKAAYYVLPIIANTTIFAWFAFFAKNSMETTHKALSGLNKDNVNESIFSFTGLKKLFSNKFAEYQLKLNNLKANKAIYNNLFALLIIGLAETNTIALYFYHSVAQSLTTGRHNLSVLLGTLIDFLVDINSNPVVGNHHHHHEHGCNDGHDHFFFDSVILTVNILFTLPLQLPANLLYVYKDQKNNTNNKSIKASITDALSNNFYFIIDFLKEHYPEKHTSVDNYLEKLRDAQIPDPTTTISAPAQPAVVFDNSMPNSYSYTLGCGLLFLSEEIAKSTGSLLTSALTSMGDKIGFIASKQPARPQ